MNTLKKYILIFASLGVLLAIGIFLFLGYAQDAQDVESIEAYAKQMVEECKDAPYRPLCYETQLPKLVSEISTVKIFDVVRQIRYEDPEYLYCHVLAHNLGRYEVSLDPDNWLDVIATGPTDGLCSNGFAHGAIVTRFNDEELSKDEFDAALNDLAIACEEREGFAPTELTKAICYHGIGHVLIHMTLANVEESIQGCGFVGIKDDGRDYSLLCTEGVYMQLFQPLEPEDFALIDMLPKPPTKETMKEFCIENSKTDMQYGACWREAWPLLGNDLFTSEGMMNYCSQLSEEQDREYCFISAFTLNGRQNLSDPEKMAATCNGLSALYKGECFARGANAYPEETPDLIQNGIDMCGLANTDEAQDQCYGFLADIASFNFHKGSAAFENMCSLLPKEWKNTCLKG